MKSLNEDLKTGNFRQVYLLYGCEAYLKRLYRDKLKAAVLPDEDTMNLTRYEGKGIEVRALIDQAETMPFFADKRLILVENSGFFKSASPELAEYIPTMPKETMMIFVEDEVDKRGKLYKAVGKAGRAVELGVQDERTLTVWILSQVKKEGKSITQEALKLFLAKAGSDMENILNELEKLFAYTWGRPAIEAADVEAICTVQTENKIFDMVRAVGQRQQKRALELYYDLLALKEPPMRILFLLARQFGALLQVKELREQGFDDADIAKRAGMQGFVVKNYLKQCAGFSRETLRQAIERCVELEEAVKTGNLGDRLSVELFIVEYSQR